MTFFVILMLVIGIIAFAEEMYQASPTYKKKMEKAAKEKQDKLNSWARNFGYDAFNETLKLSGDCGIDEHHKLMYYTYRLKCDNIDSFAVIPLKNIDVVFLRKQYAQKDKSLSEGLKDGILAGITGVGIIRDSSSLYDVYETGKMVLEMEFVNHRKNIDRISIVYDDVMYARKVENRIRNLI